MTGPARGGVEPPGGPTPRALTVGLGVLAAAFVGGGWALPLWRATLHAPQYPGGLTMHAYGTDVTGDVREISALNHYVGMRPFDLADFPELALWPWAVGLALVAIVVGLLVRRGALRLLALVYLWGLPLGVLAVIQVRLHQYGRDLDPGAALRIDPFTPLVVGPTEVWNFQTWSWPGLGLLSLVAAAAVVTFGPRFASRFTTRAAVVPVLLAILAVGSLPADAAAAVPEGSSSGRSFDLQAALDSARPGERIVVPPGTHAGPLIVAVPVVLDGRSAATIVGDGTGSVISVRAPGTVITGLEVRGSGPGPTGNPAAVEVRADHVTVERIVVADAYLGIAVEAATGVRIVDNVIEGRASGVIVDEGHALVHDASSADDRPAGEAIARARGDGIRLHDVDQALVRGNTVTDARDGVYVSFGSDTIIDGNVVRGSRYAVHSMYASDLTLVENHFADNLSGAVLMYRGPTLVLRNHVEGHDSPSTGFGLLLKDVVGAEVVENVLVGNRTGVHLDGPVGGEEPARLSQNTIARNAVGVAAYPSARAVLRGNSLVDNRIQVLPQGGRLTGLTWSAQGVGNHWSSYRGYEGIASGFGAVPHAEGGAVDRLLGRNPVLLAIADTPALRLLRAVEERWGRQDPVAVDAVPLTVPISPAVPPPAGAPAPATAMILGVALLAPVALIAFRRRPLARAPRRTDVVTA
jgi:nitrous oxidase accessory protein